MGKIEQIAEWLYESQSCVAFTGAGISTESGIPDYRSPGGVWATSDPVYFDQFLASAESRYEYWRQKSLTHAEFERAKPNVAHEILASWEQAGKLRGVVTQNIEGKHREAGSQQVLELHGTAREVSCLDCGERWPAAQWVEQFLSEDCVPDCPACGGRLKHATVSFGQQLPTDVLEQAQQWARECDLFFALGSSLVVYPASGLPEIAKIAGAKLVIINRTDTALDYLANAIINEELGPTLKAIDYYWRDLNANG